MSITCSLEENCLEEIKKLEKSETNVALILKCNKNEKKIIVDRFIENASPSTIEKFLPESSSRFILLKYYIQPDNIHKQSILALIHFNPIDLDSSIKLMYQNSKSQILLAISKGYKEFSVHSLEDFNEEWFQHKIIGVTGKMTDQLIGNNKDAPICDASRISF